jgi:hypothetical protein
MMDRYERLASAFVRLADTLVADYDVAELKRQLIDDAMTLLPIAAAGIVLTAPAGDLLKPNFATGDRASDGAQNPQHDTDEH